MDDVRNQSSIPALNLQTYRNRTQMTIFDKIFPKDDTVNTDVNIQNDRLKGKIIKVDMDRGYGFITSKDVPFTRIFFHWTSLLQDTKNFAELKKNDLVEFTKQEIEEEGIKKIRAIKIKVI